MVATSAHHLMSAAMTKTAFKAEVEPRHDRRRSNRPRIEGYAIVSADGMLADRNRHMPRELHMAIKPTAPRQKCLSLMSSFAMRFEL